jgi:hypothetical protein
LSKYSFLFVALYVIAGCSSEATAPTEVASASIGAAGGSLSGGGVMIDVPAGAVSSDTTFRISRASTSALPSGDARSEVFRLEPEGVEFSVPVRVSVALSATSDPVVLLRKGNSDPDWVAIGGAAEGATSVVGATSHFSLILALAQPVFAANGCVVPTACADFGCTGAFPSLSCSGSCSASTAIAAGMDCALAPAPMQNATGTRAACTCTIPTGSSLVPTHAEPYYLDLATSDTSPALILYQMATWCGWPCSGAQSDAGVDAGEMDAGVDGGASDMGTSATCDPNALSPIPLMVAPEGSFNREYNAAVTTGTFTTGGELPGHIDGSFPFEPWIQSSFTVQGRDALASPTRGVRMEFRDEGGQLYMNRRVDFSDGSPTEFMRAHVRLEDAAGNPSSTGPMMHMTYDCPSDRGEELWEYNVMREPYRVLFLIRPEGSGILYSEIYGAN